MQLIQAEKRFQHLSEAEVLAAWARMPSADVVLRGVLPDEETFIAENAGVQEVDGEVVFELLRLMTVYTNNICEFAERAGKLPSDTFFVPRWPIEAVALRTAKENMMAAAAR